MPTSVSRAPTPFGSREVSTQSRSQWSLNRTLLPRELIQETQVVLEQQADIVDAELEHGDPIHPQSEGESRHDLRVVPRDPKNLGVDQTRPSHLQPPRMLAGGASPSRTEHAAQVELGA